MEQIPLSDTQIVEDATDDRLGIHTLRPRPVPARATVTSPRESFASPIDSHEVAASVARSQGPVLMSAVVATAAAPSLGTPTSVLLQRVQPAMTGLIDGSLSTLAPIFAVALATHQPRYAFFAGLATAIGAGVSMAFSEGLSDTGQLTGRGSAYKRGAITGAGTFMGGILHTLPFLIPQFRAALIVAVVVIALELVTLAWLRSRFFGTGFLGSFVSVALGGAIIAIISAALGGAAG